LAGQDSDGSGSDVMCGIRDGTSGGTYFSIGTGIQNDAWHLATATRNSTVLKTYVDGGGLTTSTDAENAATLGELLRIGNGDSENIFTGYLDEFRITTDELSADWITTEHNNQNSPSTFYTVTEPSVTLIAAQGSYTYTGQNTNLLRILKVLVEQGAYTLTGFDALLNKAYGLACSAGSYVYTGFDVGFTRILKIVAELGSYTYTGFDAVLQKSYVMVIQTGSYLLTGLNAVVRRLGWREGTKSSTDWDETNKSSTTWTETNKSSTTWTESDKSL
jgi:hypothetical protein